MSKYQKVPMPELVPGDVIYGKSKKHTKEGSKNHFEVVIKVVLDAFGFMVRTLMLTSLEHGNKKRYAKLTSDDIAEGPYAIKEGEVKYVIDEMSTYREGKTSGTAVKVGEVSNKCLQRIQEAKTNAFKTHKKKVQ
jgi:hypothetical protein